jgi:pimeloyl-ACP methyl ester carboxylesterase
MNTRMALALCSLMAAPAAAAPPATTTPSADGVPIAYHVQGRGAPVLVFVHCWTCDSSFWDAQVKHEAARHQVVTLDLAGHGRSGAGRQDWTMSAFADDVVAVVKKLGLQKVVLVGHSMGGPVIVEAARKMPERVIGLVPVDTLLDVSQVMPAAQIDAAMAEMQADFKGATGRFARTYMFVPSSPPALIDDVLAKAAAADPKMAVAALLSTWAYDARAGLAAIKVPIVAVNADKFPTNVEANRQAAPQFDVVIVKGVGHYLMREKPAEFNRALDEALARVAAAGKK